MPKQFDLNKKISDAAILPSTTSKIRLITWI